MTLLNIISWDPFCPVLLPLGPSTMSSVISGSMGVFFPFLVFAVMLFYYLHQMWLENASDSLGYPDKGTLAESAYENGNWGKQQQMQIMGPERGGGPWA